MLKRLSPLALLLTILLFASIFPAKAQSITVTVEPPLIEDVTKVSGTFIDFDIMVHDVYPEGGDLATGMYGYEFMVFYKNDVLTIMSPMLFKVGLVFDGIHEYYWWFGGPDGVVDATYEVSVWVKEVDNAYNATHGRAWMSVTLFVATDANWAWNSDFALTLEAFRVGGTPNPHPEDGQLASIKFKVLKDPPAESAIDVVGALDPPMPHSTKLSNGYGDVMPNTAYDGMFRNFIPSPEFPLGISLVMAIAPAIPIVYLLRIRKKEYA